MICHFVVKESAGQVKTFVALAWGGARCLQAKEGRTATAPTWQRAKDPNDVVLNPFAPPLRTVPSKADELRVNPVKHRGIFRKQKILGSFAAQDDRLDESYPQSQKRA